MTKDEYSNSFSYRVGSEGPLTAKLAIVAEKPARQEIEQKRPLIGQAGDALREHVEKCGLDVGVKWFNENRGLYERMMSEEVYLTNAVQYFNDPDSNPTLDDVFREQPRLFRELASMPNLNCVIALGNYGLASLGNMAYSGIDKKTKAPTGIGKWRGSVIPSKVERNGKQIKMVPSFHTSFYQHGEWRFRSIVQFDIARAVAQSKFSERIYTEREYCIRPTFEEAIDWFNEIENDLDQGKYDYTLKNGDKVRGLSWDLECIKGQFNSRYVCCFAFSISPTRGYCIPLTYNNRSPYFDLHQEAEIWRRKQRLLNRRDVTLITQNGPTFDYWIEREAGIVIDPKVLAQSFDTMHAHGLLAADLPHDLGFLTSIYTDHEYYKDDSGDWIGPYIKVPEQNFWVYNCDDAISQLISAYGIMEDMIDAGSVPAIRRVAV